MKLKKSKLYKLAEKHGTDKASHGYTNYYEKLFNDSKNKKINLLELGIFRGDSIKMWNEYFDNGNIYCIDYLGPENSMTENSIFQEETINNLKNKSDKIYPYICDQTDSTTLNKIFKNIDFDFIIDDASHTQKETLLSLGILFQKLKPNGIYIIEDMCTLWDFQTGSNWGQKHKLNKDDIDIKNLPSLDLFTDTIHYVLKEFNKEKIFFSEYLSSFENNYLSENILDINIVYAPRNIKIKKQNEYMAISNPGTQKTKLSAGSLAIITKK